MSSSNAASSTEEGSPVASLVVPFFNAARWLRVTVPSLLGQDVPVEIVFVDDGSSDASRATVEALVEANQPEIEARGHRVEVLVHAANQGRSAARNSGVAATTAPLLAFVDADVALPPSWIGAQAAAHSRLDAVAVMPRRIPLGLDPVEPYHRYLAAKEERLGRADPYAPIPWSRFVTAAVTLCRDAFDSAGGFDTAIDYGEDTEIGLRIGRLYPNGFRLAPDIVAYHHDPDTLAVAVAKFTRFAERDLPRMLARYPELRDEVGATGTRGYLARAALGIVPTALIRAALPLLPESLHSLAVRGLIFDAIQPPRP
ncbi:MAG: glycosyltransferase family 2 protein [Bacteroidota bacterium]